MFGLYQQGKELAVFHIYHSFFNALSSFVFPVFLKYADIRPTFKKDDRTEKEYMDQIAFFQA